MDMIRRNFFTGGLSLIINILSLLRGDFYAAATGLLFGVTYLFVAINGVCDFEARPLHIFSVFVAVNAVVFGVIEGITGSAELGIVPDIRWAIIWWLWAVLWGSSLLTLLGKKTGKFVPVLQIVEGVITAWIPGVMMLLRVW